MNATDIIGYVRHEEPWHPKCLVRALRREGELSPAADTMPPERVIWMYHEVNALEVGDYDYAAPIFATSDNVADMEVTACAWCHDLVIEP